MVLLRPNLGENSNTADATWCVEPERVLHRWTDEEIGSWTQSARWKLSVPHTEHTRGQECADKPSYWPERRLLSVTVIEMRTTEPMKNGNDMGCFCAIRKKGGSCCNVIDERFCKPLHPDNSTPLSNRDLRRSWFIRASFCKTGAMAVM